MKAKELRKEADKLQKEIDILITKFIKDNGVCDINVYIDPVYEHRIGNKMKFIKANVKVSVSV